MDVTEWGAPKSTTGDEPVPTSVGPARRWPELVLTVLGLIVAVGLSAMTALYEAMLSELRMGTVRVPVSLLAAIVINPAIVWFTYQVTARKIAALGPVLVWTVLMVLASGRTTEGDLVLTSQNWVAISTMIAGMVSYGLAAYWLILTGLRPDVSKRPSDAR